MVRYRYIPPEHPAKDRTLAAQGWLYCKCCREDLPRTEFISRQTYKGSEIITELCDSCRESRRKVMRAAKERRRLGIHREVGRPTEDDPARRENKVKFTIHIPKRLVPQLEAAIKQIYEDSGLLITPQQDTQTTQTSQDEQGGPETTVSTNPAPATETEVGEEQPVKAVAGAKSLEPEGGWQCEISVAEEPEKAWDPFTDDPAYVNYVPDDDD